MRDRLAVVDVTQWALDSAATGAKPVMHHELLWNGGLMVALFDGPSPPGRSDFHVNTSPELFYQVHGELLTRVREDGDFRDVLIRKGEMLLIPAEVPHLNLRPEGSVGLVIHRTRAAGAKEAIVWYCDQCGHELYREEYVHENVQHQLPALINAFHQHEERRTCRQCGTVKPVPA
ncbi:3-hydroxyanthranilate 3,4-dioxygenase [Streptomyces mashuensis]|uniref:3-hydroxyanthranilate 3,4-dioxygenase n=1 Tax=Streptomyces mashuensis TaxID=33904 RepID=A0A919BAB6_9ACTN|nr:3-hydroxyanthranilate 3,4-dioxygenase [Streptomyces mashuensis]GHF70722.1 3-hydroxyanthranilate 3,4-dioxygenase [Streptomyces mashuensis]